MEWRCEKENVSGYFFSEHSVKSNKNTEYKAYVWHIWKFSSESGSFDSGPLWKENFQMGHTYLLKFLLMKNRPSQIKRVIVLKVILSTVSCDWPVINTWRYWPEFHGGYAESVILV